MARELGVCAALIAVRVCFAAAPEIESISPLAIRPGASTEIQLSGSDLPERPNLWTSFPGKVEQPGDAHSSKVRYRINTSTETPVGIGAVRIFGSNGVSSLTWLMLDDLPSVAETKTNKSRAAAQPIAIGQAIDGICDELSFDWFKLRLNKGQRASIEVVASRLGSKLDSVLRVTDARGRPVAQSDDVPGLRGESFISFTAALAGDYFVELRDVNYGGGSDFFYRLRVGDFPLATTMFPVAAEQGSTQLFQLAGPSGSVDRVEAVVATNAVAVPLASKSSGATFAKALVTTQREITEREPNDKSVNATQVSLLDGVNGRFERANDRDCYEFTARKGQRIEFRAATRSVGSPCDVVLELQAADGAQLARSNPSAADEGVIAHRFSSNGTYRLMVQEAGGAFGANCVYHIAMQRAPGFMLAIDNDRINAASGKSFDLKVTCNRGDYKGPITLALEGLAESLAVTNNVIGEGKTNATMKVTVPETFAPAVPRFFSVLGTAERDGAEVRVRASTATALRRRFPQMLYPPVEFDGVIALGVTAAK